MLLFTFSPAKDDADEHENRVCLSNRSCGGVREGGNRVEEVEGWLFKF